MKDTAIIWDPLRRKDVALTPEEEVRQWFIGVLHDSLGVPLSLMGSEVSLKTGRRDKARRADIVVYDRTAAPLAIVECKRPDVELSAEVLEQALRYDMTLAVKYLFITNGARTIVARRGGDGSISFLDKAPAYNEMLQG